MNALPECMTWRLVRSVMVLNTGRQRSVTAMRQLWTGRALLTTACVLVTTELQSERRRGGLEMVWLPV